MTDIHNMSDEQFVEFIKSLSSSERNQLMSDYTKHTQRKQSSDERSKYVSEDGIIQFVKKELKAKPTPYQEDVLRAIVKHHYVAVRAPHGVGKTTIAAWFILWMMYCHDTDVKVPITASSWLQLERYTMPEVRKWAKKLKGKGIRILKHSLKGDDKEAFVFSPDDPARAEGAHASVLGVVYDESKAIPTALFDAMEGAMMGAGDDTEQIVYALMISTPGNPQGRFYDVHSQKKGLENWHTMHITLEDGVKAGRVSQAKVDKLADLWGTESPVYKNRVLGEFDQSGDDVVIPLAWVEQAMERYNILEADSTLSLGVDPARFGGDKTAIARLQGRVILPLIYLAGKDTMQVAGKVASMATKEIPIAVDVIGIGAGVVDRLNELGYDVTGVNVAQAAKDDYGVVLRDMTEQLEFVNLRSWVWWHMRDMLNPDNPNCIALPPDDKLLGDLTTPKYDYKSNGKIYVESKDDIRKRLKRSTDGADAVGLALYNAFEGTGTGFVMQWLPVPDGWDDDVSNYLGWD